MPSGISAAVPRRGSPRVLVVDDSVLVQRMATSMLTLGGYRVTVAGSGHIAIDMLAAHRFDVVLMDVQMPEMDGPMATARLRHLGHRAPVVALTASTHSAEWQRCREAGMDDYVSKPFHMRELLSVVKRWAQPAESSALS